MRRGSIAGAVAAALLTCGMATPVSAIDLPRPTINVPRPTLPTVHGNAVSGSPGTTGAPGAGRIEKLPGRTKWGDITLNRGVVKDKPFSDWSTGATSGGATSGGAASPTAGSHSEKLPGRTKWGNITLNRGVVKNKSFSDWSTGVTGSRATIAKGGSSSVRCHAC